MPANAMRISQLITVLQDVQRVYGDLDVVIPYRALDRVLALQEPSVIPQAGYPWRSLIRPVLSLEPTEEYQATPDSSGEWSYDLGLAPEATRVRVMKRIGGEDVGERRGDVWLVYEGGDRAWQIVSGGVLAWAPLL